MVSHPRIHILDDDPTFAKILAANLGRAGEFRIEVFNDPETFLDEASSRLPDAVITDLVMPGMDSIDVTRRLRRLDPCLPVFILTSYGEVTSAVEALKAGANDYLTKPVNVDELLTQLRRSLEDLPLKEEAATLHEKRKELFSVDSILGTHAKIEEVRKFVQRVADIPKATVLLFGESGTGKNLVARAIHYSGPQRDKRFVEVNCSALPSELLEAELFGYQKGAFTGANESKRGLIEVADSGTLFLDEIAELSPGTQAKLLNFLESRTFRRVGSTEEIQVDLRLVTATNRELEQLVEEGAFRQDLYYRIRVVTHTLPPLREVSGDLPALVDHFREAFNREFGKTVKEVGPEAMERLTGWNWPGNVRELRNVIERAMIFAEGARLTVEALPTLTAPGERRDTDADGAEGFRIPSGLTLKEAEREYIRRTLKEHGGGVQLSAEILGISRKNLWEKRKQHGLLD